MDRRQFLLALPPATLALAQANAGPAGLVFDGAKPGKPIRPLHGVNGGPLAAGGLLDLSARWKEAGFPLARLHDCHWPNPDVVDVHAVFPDPAADPDRPDSYDFARTDEYLKAIHDAGCRVVYRLGESIEHQKVKRHARPPRDFDRWAKVCVGVARHYTQGWANGFEYPVAYWEVWNEPDNRPACWTGTDDDYLLLYAVTAKALRAACPKLKVGGPGLGNTGKLTPDGLEPTPFLGAFLARCRRSFIENGLPLDFFSWHCYTADPAELTRRAKGVRQVLDAAGFKDAESHLNEWNYLPGGDWAGMMAADPDARHAWHDRVAGPEGAAFTAAALCILQDGPVDAACYFTAEPQGIGLFSPHGRPTKPYHALRAFKDLAGLRRLPAAGELPAGVAALAGVGADGETAAVLLARHAGAGGPLVVEVRPAPWAGPAGYEVLGVDDRRDLARVGAGTADGCRVTLDLPAHAVRLVRWRRAKP